MKLLIILFLLIITTFNIHAQPIEYNKDYRENRYFLNREKLKIWKLNQVIKDKKALQLLDSAQGHRVAGGLFGVVGGFMVGWTLGNVIIGGEEEINWRFLTAGFGISFVSLSFNTASKNRIREAVEIHNTQFDSSSHHPPSFQLRLEANGNKIGVTLNF